MASATKASSIVPLNGPNYPAWKIRCRMAYMKDGTKTVRPQTEAERYEKYVARKKRALTIVVLSIEPCLLYLLGRGGARICATKGLRNNIESIFICIWTHFLCTWYPPKFPEEGAIASLPLPLAPPQLLRDPQDPVVVWNKLAAQFWQKTWANKLAFRRKLFSLSGVSNVTLQIRAWQIRAFVTNTGIKEML